MEKSIGFEIRGLLNLVKREMQKYNKVPMESSTPLHGAIVEYLLQNQHKDVFQRDFEEEFMMRRSTVSRMLKLMEKNGIIQRLSVGRDARLKKIVLTDKAFEINKKVKEFESKMDSKMTNGIAKDELAVFFKVLDQIKKNMEE